MDYKVNILEDSFSYAVTVLKLNWNQGTRLENYNKEWSYFNKKMETVNFIKGAESSGFTSSGHRKHRDVKITVLN